MPPKPQAAPVKRCSVDGCKVRLEGANANSKCGKCGLAVCNNHIFPSDHTCLSKTTAAAPKLELVVEKKHAKDAFPALQVTANASKGADVGKPAIEEQVPVVTTLQGEVAEALYNDFVQAATKRRIIRLAEAGKLVQALNSLGNDSRLEANIVDVARSTIGRVATMPGKDDVVTGLESVLFHQEPLLHHAGPWIAYGMLIGRIMENDAGLFDAVDRTAIRLTNMKEPQPWIGRVFSEALRFRRLDCDPSLSENTRVVDLLQKLAVKTGPDVARSAALIMAGIADGVGAPNSIHDLKLFSLVPDATQAHILQALAEVCGPAAEPFVWKWSKSVGDSLYGKYCKGEPDVRFRALLAAKAICQNSLGPVGVDEWVPNLVKGAKDPLSWRGKEYCLDVLETLISQKSDLLHDHLPSIVLAMASCVVEAKKEVASKASSGLDAVGASVTNPETKRLMPFILDAIKRPDACTDKCLSELMDATFVNSLNATSVALILPVVTRALREGSADLKRRGATATGNVCALVRDVDDVRQFEQGIRAELDKLKEHSSPEVRNAAEKARASITKALGGVDGVQQITKTSRPKKEDEIISKECVAEVRESMFPNAETGAFALVAVKRLASIFLVLPARDVANDLEKDIRVTLPFLEDREVTALTNAILSRIRKARSSSFDNLDANHGSKDEVLVDIKDMILAYASRVLLSKTRITLKKGHRYGIVGKIGVGKTTLASRLAKGDLENFPSNVSTYMILHEVLQEDMGKTVWDYMGGNELAKETLFKVGFADPNVLVSTLSGGWRMRLAIARSMLANADLIVLDEPTNHVDVSGVAWLAQYLRSLEETGVTCVIVSHDYDFLTEVATDILHIHDQRLDDFQGGFADFQKAFPEIAAALPKMHQPTPNPSRTNTPAVVSAEDTGDLSAGVSREPTPRIEAEGGGEAGMAIFDLLAQNESNPEVVAKLLASRSIPSIRFPDPGKLEGITSRGKPVMTVADVTYAYPSNPEKIVLKRVSCKLSLNSRVALRGANGQGKSTLMKLIVGELGMNETSSGTIWKHHNLRVAYVAQHAIHHLMDHLDITPTQYLQRRYYEGRDRERGEMVTMALDENDKSAMAERGEVCGILSRVTRGKQLFYEIEVTGRRRVGEGGDGRSARNARPDDSSNAKEFRSLAQLEAMKKPHVMKLVKMFDEELKYEASGLAIRPVTQVEILNGLQEFGIDSDFAERKIRWLSGGQKSRLVLAAAMWHRPHLICLDGRFGALRMTRKLTTDNTFVQSTPTNFLDAETLAVLTHSLRAFKGAVLTVSHHEAFVQVLCNEAWDMNAGELKVTILKEKLKEKLKVGAAVVGKAAVGGGRDGEDEE